MDFLNIHPRIVNALKHARLKMDDYDTILGTSTSEIGRETKLKPKDIEILRSAVSGSIYGPLKLTALDLYKNRSQRLTTGCKVLDSFLRGGILQKGITEVAGESGSGKSQLCLQLSLCVQLPTSQGGLEGGAVYICTESAFPNKRLHQMINSRPGVFSSRFGDRIFIEHVAETDDLLECVDKKLPMLLNTGCVKLVIIDSVAALFRVDDSGGSFIRSQKLARLSKTLLDLSWKYSVPVVCVNQVTDVVNNKTPRKTVTPALGLTWANGVTCRLMLHRTQQTINIQQENAKGEVVDNLTVIVRDMEVSFAPHLPSSTCKFLIDPEGVKGIESGR